MGKISQILMSVAVVLSLVGADGPTPVPADFKLQIASFALGSEPVYSEDVVIRKGRAYLFPSNSAEVIIIEPARSRLELLDVARKVQAEVTFQELDESLGKIKTTLREAAEDREKRGGRANTVEAKITRDLFETKLKISHDPKAGRVRLTNPVVEVDALGQLEEDAPRLAHVSAVLTTIAKLGAYRSPKDLPPFIELETIAALTGERRLRPTELAYLYRLAGPPKKFRRTYQLIPKLTDREVEAISRVDQLRLVAPSLRFERYKQAR